MTSLISSILHRAFPDFRRDLMMVYSARVPAGHEELSNLEIMVLLLEDRRFYRHRGIDWSSWIREIWMMCTLRRFGGASTIDMQFVRTVTGYKSPTLRRKFYEMLLAYALQSQMSKAEILRSYLHIAYFGTGIFGSRAAAEIVFDKELFELSQTEAAYVASMLVYPRPRDPSTRWRKNVERRSAYGLRLFQRYGAQYIRHFDQPSH